MSSAPTSQSSLLVVDDDAMIRFVLDQILSDAGYQVHTASDGQAALDTLQQAATLPCAILLDLNMPVMTGWEFRLEQKRDPRLLDVPVIVISADRSIEHQPFSIDALDYFVKPIDYPRLLNVINGICP
jgi:CheY-like chemotaxis protein